MYALIALVLTGLLIAAMTEGAKKNASSIQLDEMMLFLQADLKTIHMAINECVQLYPKAVDGITNPNVPFPLYSNMAGGAFVNNTVNGIDNIQCPGAPAGQQTIFDRNAGNNFKLLGDTNMYTTIYMSDATEGVYVRVTRAKTDAVWTEALSRLNTKYSPCSAAAVPPGSGAPCENGCFYYWIMRPATSTLGGETAQPACAP